jgi:dinuclear metal center YbgI/SA1388 family protein
MAKLNAIVKYLNKELNVKKINDSKVNGLNHRSKTNEIEKIGFAVDGCMDSFKQAIKLKCGLLVVHHGIKRRPEKFPSITKKRFAFLKKHNLSVYGVHLPLDLHRKYGNNIRLCKMFRLTKIKKFGWYNGQAIGYSGQFKKSVSLSSLVKSINKKLKTKSKVLPFGKKKVKTMGVVSGGGEINLPEAAKKKLDVLLIGEIKHGSYQRTKEWKINAIDAGHYATEVWGVKALMPVLREKFGVRTVFIDLPTGL